MSPELKPLVLYRLACGSEANTVARHEAQRNPEIFARCDDLPRIAQHFIRATPPATRPEP